MARRKWQGEIRMSVMLGAFAAFAVALLPATVSAQAYPSRPLRFIVPSAPGGSPDINSRELAAELTKQMGQQVVVENRPGASGILGYEMLARASADGYTFAYISNFVATNPSLYARLPYDFFRDFQPVIHYFGGINILTDTRYFTRRASGYPGPGVLPADGRTFFITIGYRTN